MAHQSMTALSQRKHASTGTFLDNCGDLIAFNNLGVIE
jgi:hypothetical protein